MNTLIVSYDLGQPESSSDYAKLGKYIKDLEDWCKPLESFWIIRTSKTAKEIRDEIRALVDDNDRVLVLDVSVLDWATLRIKKGATDWFKENL